MNQFEVTVSIPVDEIPNDVILEECIKRIKAIKSTPPNENQLLKSTNQYLNK